MRQNRLGAAGCQIGSKADYQVSNIITCTVAPMQCFQGESPQQFVMSADKQHLSAAFAGGSSGEMQEMDMESEQIYSHVGAVTLYLSCWEEDMPHLLGLKRIIMSVWRHLPLTLGCK